MIRFYDQIIGGLPHRFVGQVGVLEHLIPQLGIIIADIILFQPLRDILLCAPIP